MVTVDGTSHPARELVYDAFGPDLDEGTGTYGVGVAALAH